MARAAAGAAAEPSGPRAGGRRSGSAAPVAPAVRLGLPDQVVTQLLGAVARGEHPPGSRLPPEAELAARADVSRLTLREAVKVLRDKGVLRVEQGRGTFVNPPTLWSPLDPELLATRTVLEGGSPGALAEQLTEARGVVEVGLVGLAARRRTEPDLDLLRDRVADMQAAHERGDVPAFSAADTAFHEVLLVAAANPVLGALYEPIRTLVHQLRVTTATDAAVREQALAAHRAILDAVAASDPAAAAQATAEHVEQTHRVVAEAHPDSGPGAAPRPARPQETR